MPREEVYGTGRQSIRYAAKVDLSKHAATQPQLHASTVMDIPMNNLLTRMNRIDGILIASIRIYGPVPR